MNINMRIRAYVYGSVHNNALARFILMLAVTFHICNVESTNTAFMKRTAISKL